MVKDSHEETDERDYMLHHEELILPVPNWGHAAKSQPQQQYPCCKPFAAPLAPGAPNGNHGHSNTHRSECTSPSGSRAAKPHIYSTHMPGTLRAELPSIAWLWQPIDAAPAAAHMTLRLRDRRGCFSPPSTAAKETASQPATPRAALSLASAGLRESRRCKTRDPGRSQDRSL
jgi:hypothetical protein